MVLANENPSCTEIKETVTIGWFFLGNIGQLKDTLRYRDRERVLEQIKSITMLIFVGQLNSLPENTRSRNKTPFPTGPNINLLLIIALVAAIVSTVRGAVIAVARVI